MADVLTVHNFERFNRRHLGRNRTYLFEVLHDALYTGLIPRLPGYPPDFLGREQANDVVIGSDKKAMARAVQQVFVNKITDVQVSGDGRTVALHQFGDAAVAKIRHDSHLSIARACRIKQKPTDKSDPQTAKACTRKKAVQPEQNEEECHSLTNLRGPSRGLLLAAADPPKK